MRIHYEIYKGDKKSEILNFDFTDFNYIKESKGDDIDETVRHSDLVITAKDKDLGKAVGFLNIEYTPDNTVSPYNIQFIEVVDGYKQQGIGSGLLSVAFAYLIGRNASKVSIIDNSGSNFFSKRGFVKELDSMMSFYV